MISVGIDVAKDKHDCFIISSEGEVLADVFTLPNSLDGSQSLLQKIRSCSSPQDKIKVGLEATGHYSYNILGFLLDNDLPAYVLNSPAQQPLARMGVTILAEVGDFSRFRFTDNLLVYAGLSPSTCPDSSRTAMLIWKSAVPYISDLLFSTPPGTFSIGIPFLPLISPKSGRKASITTLPSLTLLKSWCISFSPWRNPESLTGWQRSFLIIAHAAFNQTPGFAIPFLNHLFFTAFLNSRLNF